MILECRDLHVEQYYVRDCKHVHCDGCRYFQLFPLHMWMISNYALWSRNNDYCLAGYKNQNCVCGATLQAKQLCIIPHCVLEYQQRANWMNCTIKNRDFAWGHSLNSYFFTSSNINFYAVRSSIIRSVVNFWLVLIQVASSKLRNSWLLLKCGGLTC